MPFVCLILLSLFATLATPTVVRAQDRITVAEVIPVLAGSEVGQLELGPAPAPGRSRVVHAREVRAALKKAGVDATGIRIPKRRRIERAARSIEPAELAQLARHAIEQALGACHPVEITSRQAVQVGTGELDISASAPRPTRSGQGSVMLALASDGRTVRVPVRVRYDCPPPVIRSGAAVTVIAVVGNVRATAPAVAAQAGRVGDRIHVTNRLTGSRLLAQVVDATTVEVVP